MNEINQQRLWHLIAWVLFGASTGAAINYAGSGDLIMVVAWWAGALLSLLLAAFAWIEMDRIAEREQPFLTFRNT